MAQSRLVVPTPGTGRPAAELPATGGRADVHGADGAPARRFVSVYAALVLVLGTGAFTAMSESDLQSTFFAIWAVAYAVAVAGLVDDRFRNRRRLLIPVVVLLFVGLAVVSVVWSVTPAITLRRSVGLLGTVLVGVYLAHRLTALEIFEALRRAVVIIAVVSLILYLSGSPLALDEVHGTLRGILPTKNTLGRVLALGVLASAAVGLMDPRRRRRALVSGVLMVALLPLTASTGGTAMAVAVIVTGVAIAVIDRRRGRIATVGLGAIALAGALALLPTATVERLTGAVGEDATLTGRTDIWDATVHALGEHPVLGYGYGAFWNIEDPTPQAQRIRAGLQWEVPHSHNGLLDLALDVGIVGAALGLMALVVLVFRGVADLRAQAFHVATLRLAVAAVTVIANLAESGLFQLNSVYTVLLVAAIAVPSPDRTGDGKPAPPVPAGAIG